MNGTENLKGKVIEILKTETVLAASVGAAIISAFFNPPSAQYLSFINIKVLLCLFCLMVVVAGFKKQGAFEAAAIYVAKKSRNMRSLTFGILILTYFLAMVMTNDVALITLVPFTLILLDKIGQNQYAILIIVLQTIGANIGSSLTPVGNPQNLYLFSHYKIPLGEFFLILLPVVLLGGLLLFLSCFFIEKKALVGSDYLNEYHEIEETNIQQHLKVSAAEEKNHGISVKNEFDNYETSVLRKKHSILPSAVTTTKKGRLIALTSLFLLSVLAVFNVIPIEWVTIFLVISILLLDRHLFKEVDYGLLLTFIGFFIFVGNISALPAVKAFLSALLSKGVFIISLLASQVISNVPAAVLLSGFTSDHRALLLGVNVGGMGTLIASLASVISYKLYTKAHPKMARRYIKIFTGLNLAFLAVLCLAVLFSYLFY